MLMVPIVSMQSINTKFLGCKLERYAKVCRNAELSWSMLSIWFLVLINLPNTCLYYLDILLYILVVAYLGKSGFGNVQALEFVQHVSH